MERKDKHHMEEKLNLRSFYLRLIRKIWILPIAAVIGAVLGGAIYTFATVVLGPGREYSTESKFYIDFAYDEDAGSMVDWYNAYSWNILMDTDEISNVIMAELSNQSVSLTKEEVIASITADIPSDVRLLIITVKNSNQDLTNKITQATIKAIENYGDINVAFDSIRTLGTTEASLVVTSNRTVVAIIFGAILGVLAAFFAMMLFSALDDAIYVPEDCAARYGIPAIGMTFAGGENNDLFRNELIASYKKITEGTSEIVFISTDSVNDAVASENDFMQLKKTLGDHFDENSTKVTAMGVPGSVLDNYRKIATADGVILSVPAGKHCGTMCEHVIAQLKKHDCPVLGILLSRQNLGFIKKYYRVD